MALKVDLENYRDRAGTPAAAPSPQRTGARTAPTINWKIVRALGLALLVWALIAAVLLSL